MESFKIKLQAIIEQCSTIRDALKQDGTHFSKNAIESLKMSNETKSTLLADLMTTIDSLDQTYFSSFSGDLSHKMQAFLATTPSDEHDEINHLITTMQNEVQQCYRQLIVNTNVISAHFEHMKMIYDHLTGDIIPKTPIYDEKGLLSNT